MPADVINHPLAGGVTGLEHRHQYAIQREILVRGYDVLNPAQDLWRRLKR